MLKKENQYLFWCEYEYKKNIILGIPEDKGKK